MEVLTNRYQTPIGELKIDSYPNEIQEQFYDFINNVPYILRLISPNRLFARDLEKDEEGKIIVDITLPHILEDMDYFRPSAIHFLKYGCYTNLRPNSNPNSEYGKWIREEVRRCWEGYIRKSDGEWVTGDMYFFLNYCPILLIKEDSKGNTIRTIDFPKVWDGHYYKTHYLYLCRLEGHHAMELASRGRGKAHPYSLKVLTPFGWKLWQDIKLGDYLYGDDGNLTKIIDIPYDLESDIYTVTLRDGRKIQCTDGHLFKVKNHKTKKILIKSLKEIIIDYKSPRKVTNKCPKGIEYNYRIPKNNAVYFPHNRVEIDAYTLGLLIGDGCFRVTSSKNYILFTCLRDDFELYDSVIPYNIDKVTKDNYTYAIRVPNDYLKRVNLWYLKSEFKFVPKEYLYNSKEIRLELLRGLMDADGTVDKTSGIPVFSTTSRQLKEDVEFLCRSLGYNISTSLHESKLNNKVYNPHYRIRIITNDKIFKLPRKLKLLTSFSSGYSRSTRDYTAIVNIEYSHREMAKCVTVDNESNCYLIGDFVVTHNSYMAAAMLAKRFILGESSEVNKKVQCVATASERKYILGANQLLDMFLYYIDHCAKTTLFPSKRLTSSLLNLAWTMGYLDVDTGVRRGTENSVVGITSKDDESKLRGSRGVLYLLEEAGSFPRLLKLYSVLRPSVEDGKRVWGLIYGYGTAGDSESDFSSMLELMYNPKGYNIKGVTNIYDKEGLGRQLFTYFFPGYLDMADCYDKDGNSNVTKALLSILIDRYTVKYNSTDLNAITKRIAEIPITPLEAILRTVGNIFPVTLLNERLNLLDATPNIYDDVYIGNLTLDKLGEILFTPSSDAPIRDFPLKDNKAKGAIEIFSMPERDNNNKVFLDRYLIGHDPVDNDEAESMSLTSTFVLDLWTDRIVAEYTGRLNFAEDNYEIVRMLCLLYNAKCLYEAHPYSQKVFTPEGVKLWKDINIGDKLFSPTNGIVIVTDIPIEESMPIYKITLDDGRVIEASDSHKWLVYKGTSKTLIETTTLLMLTYGVKNKWNQSNFFIPEHNGVDYKENILPIDPYTMGLILSEGSIRGAHCFKNGVQISSSCEDMKFYEQNIPYKVRHIGNKGASWHVYIQNCKDIMLNYNLYGTDSHTKFIPNDYLYSSRELRLELLKGLMDGDGCAKTGGASIFITCSYLLALDMLSLIRSLGIKGWLLTSRVGVYRVAIASELKIFKLPRKVEVQHIYSPYTKGSKASAILNKTAIKSIEYSHREMGKCVTVNSEDGLYLIGDYVTTHNCNKKGIFAYFSKMNSTHLLADTPDYLRDKQLIKYSSFGSAAKGVNASLAINNYANLLIRDWLLKPCTTIMKEDGEEVELTIPNLYFLKNRALIKELILFNPDINVDRVRALGMLMLYREEKMVLYLGNPLTARDYNPKDYLGNDTFFLSYDDIFKKQ